MADPLVIVPHFGPGTKRHPGRRIVVPRAALACGALGGLFDPVWRLGAMPAWVRGTSVDGTVVAVEAALLPGPPDASEEERWRQLGLAVSAAAGERREAPHAAVAAALGCAPAAAGAAAPAAALLPTNLRGYAALHDGDTVFAVPLDGGERQPVGRPGGARPLGAVNRDGRWGLVLLDADGVRWDTPGGRAVPHGAFTDGGRWAADWRTAPAAMGDGGVGLLLRDGRKWRFAFVPAGGAGEAVARPVRLIESGALRLFAAGGWWMAADARLALPFRVSGGDVQQKAAVPVPQGAPVALGVADGAPFVAYLCGGALHLRAGGTGCAERDTDAVAVGGGALLHPGGRVSPLEPAEGWARATRPCSCAEPVGRAYADPLRPEPPAPRAAFVAPPAATPRGAFDGLVRARRPEEAARVAGYVSALREYGRDLWDEAVDGADGAALGEALWQLAR